MMDQAGPAQGNLDDLLEIEGGNRLLGEVAVSGSKNAALPEMAAALLSDGPLLLTNLPEIEDVGTMSAILESLGVRQQRSSDQLLIDPRGLKGGVRTSLPPDGCEPPWCFWVPCLPPSGRQPSRAPAATISEPAALSSMWQDWS